MNGGSLPKSNNFPWHLVALWDWTICSSERIPWGYTLTCWDVFGRCTLISMPPIRVWFANEALPALLGSVSNHPCQSICFSDFLCGNPALTWCFNMKSYSTASFSGWHQGVDITLCFPRQLFQVPWISASQGYRDTLQTLAACVVCCCIYTHF